MARSIAKDGQIASEVVVTQALSQDVSVEIRWPLRKQNKKTRPRTGLLTTLLHRVMILAECSRRVPYLKDDYGLAMVTTGDVQVSQ